MRWLNYFRSSHKSSARTAKERLQVIIAHERQGAGAPDYLPRLQREILEVVRRYAEVSENDVKVEVEREDGCEVLALSVALPEERTHALR
jgi:cell division topological specificity factor